MVIFVVIVFFLLQVSSKGIPFLISKNSIALFSEIISRDYTIGRALTSFKVVRSDSKNIPTLFLLNQATMELMYLLYRVSLDNS